MRWMNHTDFWAGMLVHLWQSTLVIVGLWALAGAVRRAPARFHTSLWWLALAKLLLPASIVVWFVARVGASPAAGLAEPLARLSQNMAVLGDLPGRVMANRTAATSGWWAVATAVWLTGALVVPSATWLRARARARRAPGPMPCVVGFWRPRVVVPDRVRRALSAEELCAVTLHEEIHCRRRDPQKGALAVLAGSLFWFFPLAWLAIRRLRAATEIACDEAVVAAGVRPEAYARALARTIRLGLVPALGTAHLARCRQSVAHRIERIHNPGGYIAMRRHDLVRLAAFALLAVSLLPPMAAGRTQEASRAQLRQLLVEEHADLARLTGAGRRVNLVAREEPLPQVLRRLARHGGFEVSLDVPLEAGDSETSIGLTLRNVTVAEALATLADAHGLKLVVSPDGGRLFVGEPVRIGGEIQAPERIGYVAPRYPEQARRDGIQGVVILELTLDKEGQVSDARVLRSVHPLLDEAAVESAMQWLYTPVVFNGRTVETLLTATVQFRLQ